MLKIHAITTGYVKITQNWMVARKPYSLRLPRTVFDRRFTEWLPIWVWVIEHPAGLVVIDTGIPADANKRIWFPPFMPLVQRAAPFKVSEEDEIGPQMKALNLNPADVRWVIVTHLHQDHDGGFAHFPNAEILISRTEWNDALGFAGRMGDYLQWRWSHLNPTLIDYPSDPTGIFMGKYTVAELENIHLVPTPGHTTGHLSVMVEDDDQTIFIAGDVAYSQELLLQDAVDGVGPDPQAQHISHVSILKYAAQTPTVFLPSHEAEAEGRLRNREPIALSAIEQSPLANEVLR